MLRGRCAGTVPGPARRRSSPDSWRCGATARVRGRRDTTVKVWTAFMRPDRNPTRGRFRPAIRRAPQLETQRSPEGNAAGRIAAVRTRPPAEAPERMTSRASSMCFLGLNCDEKYSFGFPRLSDADPAVALPATRADDATVPSDLDGKAEHDDDTDDQCGDAGSEQDQPVAFGDHLRGHSGEEQHCREQHTVERT